MSILLFLIGFISGLIISFIFKRKDKSKIYGQIDVEETSGLCRVRIGDDGLMDPNVKEAIFKVNHNSLISRNEQGL